MSDVVPPEVRPKPAVPAKPPNVGAPSPSSPFPPQGPGVGLGGISAPPPSAIPVPIGSHGPSHGGSHVVGHGIGHGGSHTGSHAAAHSGSHGHGGSHSSSGGSTLLGYIGIDTIIEQMRKKTMKTGFDFNIMVVGTLQWTSFMPGQFLVLFFFDLTSSPFHLRTQWSRKVNPCEHLIQVPGEQEECRLGPRWEDPQNCGDQVRVSRWVQRHRSCHFFSARLLRHSIREKNSQFFGNVLKSPT